MLDERRPFKTPAAVSSRIISFGCAPAIPEYSGHSEWKHFYAVIYCTEEFVSSGTLLDQRNRQKPGSNWKIFPVYGQAACKKSQL
jgi:hypothetical protein